MIGYYTGEELSQMGFKKIGKNVKISKTATLYNVSSIKIGNNVRIDNFCVIALSGEGRLSIGNHVHIGAFCYINGLCSVFLEDYVTLAPYNRIFSSTDDYSGQYMTGATLPKHLLGTFSAKVTIERHTIVGTGSSIMPGVTLKTGTAVAAHSFVQKSTEAFETIGGVPAKFIKKRAMNFLELEKQVNETEG